jgi:hypothetical protein
MALEEDIRKALLVAPGPPKLFKFLPYGYRIQLNNMAKIRGKKTAAGLIVATVAAADSITVQGAQWGLGQGHGQGHGHGQGSRVALNARNNAELRANAQTILTMIQDIRPKNTTAAYAPKQREFAAFCAQKQYHDADTVTEDKLLLFLVEEVADRPLRAKSRKAASDTPRTATRLAWRSVRSYITAITDLYRAQKALGMNVHPSPREDNVRDYLKSLQRRDAQQDKANYADKGRDTLLDGYTEQEFERVCHELWAHNGTSTECHLRTLVDLLLGHYMLTRGGDRRAAEISDLFTFEFEEEGPTRCIPLIFTTRAGKQNQHGRLETAGALRNKKPVICMLSGLAFYLLYRWDLSGEPFPNFSQRSAWYDIRVIKASDTTEAISYNSQRDWVVKAFEYAGIASKKKTHIGRSSGAKTAELKGISEDQIRRAGRWNQEQMIGCYLNSLPREFMRTMAGHSPQRGCFELRRAGVAPPASLLAMIWPKLDAWRDRFGLQPDQINDLAAMGLTNLLFYLREVILQDSVFLKRQFPRSPVWNHPVFQHKDYTLFEQQVLLLIDEGERPSQLALLAQAMPVLADYLKAIDARNEVRIADVLKEVRTAREQLVQGQVTHASHVLGVLSAGFTVELKPTTPASASAITLGSQSPTPTSTPAPTPTPTPVAPAPSEPPQYRMCRTTKTVEELWREWTVGLQGEPAITALDSRWGSQWRAGRQSELQWYSLRLEVIKEIRRLAQSRRTSEEAAMRALDLQQQQSGHSIDQLCKLLRRGRKARVSRVRKRAL